MNTIVGLISRTNSEGRPVGVKRRARGVTLFAAALLMSTLCPLIEEASGQTCRPTAVVGYIVRDKKGKVLSEEELESVRKQLTSEWHFRRMPFSDDGKTLIGELSEEATRARNLVPLLSVAKGAAGNCVVRLEEVSLKYGDKTMRLVFNIWVRRSAIAIDSLPFEEGTFELGLNKEWPDRTEPYKGENYVPAERWKKISDKP